MTQRKTRSIGAPANLTPGALLTALLTDEQAAALLSVEPRTLRLWRNTRGLPFLRVTPKVIRYRRSDIDEWLARSRTVISA